jgi:hypothetical protein
MAQNEKYTKFAGVELKGKKTKAGRQKYMDERGQTVSEKSLTFKLGNKYVNVPSIHDGFEYRGDEVFNMLRSGKIKPTSTHNTEKEAIQAAEKRSKNLYQGGLTKTVPPKRGPNPQGLKNGGCPFRENGVKSPIKGISNIQVKGQKFIGVK